MIYFIAFCTALTGFASMYLSFDTKGHTKESLLKQPKPYLDGCFDGLKNGVCLGLFVAFLISFITLFYLVDLK